VDPGARPQHFPDATCILDFRHASESLGEMAKLVHPRDAEASRTLCERWINGFWNARAAA